MFELTYDAFKDALCNGIREQLSQKFQGENMELIVTPSEQITLQDTKEKMSCIYTLSILDLYKKYQMEEGESLDDIISSTANLFSLFAGIQQKDEGTLKQVKECIVFELANPEVIQVRLNQSLETIPHRKFLDLAMIYRWIINNSTDPIHGFVESTVIQYDLAEMLGVTEEELYILALKNTKRMYPATVDEITNFLPGINGQSNMRVITNKSHFKGAYYMTYPDILQTIADDMGTDLYILPSSIHEVIVVPMDESMEVEYLSQMVRSINSEFVEPNEVLSNNVYQYNRETQKVTLAG